MGGSLLHVRSLLARLVPLIRRQTLQSRIDANRCIRSKSELEGECRAQKTEWQYIFQEFFPDP